MTGVQVIGVLTANIRTTLIRTFKFEEDLMITVLLRLVRITKKNMIPEERSCKSIITTNIDLQTQTPKEELLGYRNCKTL